MLSSLSTLNSSFCTVKYLKQPWQIFYLDVHALTWRYTAKCSFRILPLKKIMQSTWLKLFNCIYDDLGDSPFIIYDKFQYVHQRSMQQNKSIFWKRKHAVHSIPSVCTYETRVRKVWRRTVGRNRFFESFVFIFYVNLSAVQYEQKKLWSNVLFLCCVVFTVCLSVLVSCHMNSYFLKQVRCGILQCDG